MVFIKLPEIFKNSILGKSEDGAEMITPVHNGVSFLW